jgi:ribosome-associated translation inhibitor RaiA
MRGRRPASTIRRMHVDVTRRGDVPDAALEAAREKVGALDRVVKGPVLEAHVVLTQEPNPRVAMPARAEGEVDLAGHPVRGRVAAATMPAAVDALAEHLQRQLRRYVDRVQDASRSPAEAAPGEWFHGAWTPPRPAYVDRPPEERRIVRRKTFAVDPETLWEAAAELAALDHDFLLFRHRDTGADAVLYRRDDGRLEVIAPSGTAAPADIDGVAWTASRFSEPIDVDTARAEMDVLSHRFLFFVNRASGRGNVIYLRYDGHYGVLEPAA